MNISFTIPDELDVDLIAAVRGVIPDRPDLSDARVIKKHLKNLIAAMIDAHKKELAVGATRTQVETLRLQSNTLVQNLATAREDYRAAREAYEAGFTPTSTGPEE